MAAKADAAGFILVYPRGTGFPLGFDGGGNCCGDAAHDRVDDVLFTRAMLNALEANLCVNPARVYATGMSNGGFMSHRLACELSDRIAAIAPVAGVEHDDRLPPHAAGPGPRLPRHRRPGRAVHRQAARRLALRRRTIAAWVARDACTGATPRSRRAT